MNLMRFILPLLILAALARPVRAATLASDGSTADVQAKHDAASDGDEVTMPAGDFHWSSGVFFTKRITLRGLGTITTATGTHASGYAVTCGTRILDDYVAGNLIFWTIPSYSGLAAHVQGIQFESGTDTTAPQEGAIKMNGRLDDRRIRISYCVFKNLTGDAILPDSVYGVVDHCWVSEDSHQRPLDYTYNRLAVADGSNTHGTEVWTADDNWTGDKFLFFEDCYIKTELSGWHLTLSDGSGGARKAFRWCNFRKGSLENHGAEAAWDTGGRCHLLYNCGFEGSGDGNLIIYSRSGAWRVHDIEVTGYGATPILAIIDDRTHEQLFWPFGGADGRNPWDINDGGNPIATGTVTTGTATESVNVSKSIFATGMSFSDDDFNGRQIRVTSGLAVTSATRSGVTGTIRAPGHTFTNGQVVSIWGANEYGWNFRFRTTSVGSPTADDFTILMDYPVTTPATGTLKCRAGASMAMVMDCVGASKKIIYTDSVYYANLPFGWEMSLQNGDTFEINRVTNVFNMVGAGKWDSALTGEYPSVPGGGFTQALNPSYEWNNTGDAGYNVQFSVFGVYGNNPVIVENRDFYNDTTPLGHTDYQYPHALVSGIVVTVTAAPKITRKIHLRAK